MKINRLLCLLLAAMMLFAVGCSSSDESDRENNETQEASQNQEAKEEESAPEQESTNEFEAWQQTYSYYGTPLDGFVKIYDYLFKCYQETDPHAIGTEDEKYGDVSAFALGPLAMNITDIHGDITYNNPGKETWSTPRETNDIRKCDHEDSMTKNGDIYTYVQSVYYADGDEITTINFDSANNTVDVVITNSAEKSGASPVRAQYVMVGNELFIIESRQIKGNIRNVILYYDGTVSKFAVEETNAPGEPQVTFDIIANNANWDSMFASSAFSNIFGEFDNSSGNFTFTAN